MLGVVSGTRDRYINKCIGLKPQSADSRGQII